MSNSGPANKARRHMLAAALSAGAAAPAMASLITTNSLGSTMAGSLLPQPKQLFQDANWNPLIGGKIYTYAAGTLTPKTTYQDAALTIANANPTVANARGEVLMFGSGTYRVILKDAAGNTIYDVDNVESSQSIVDSLRQDLDQATGATMVGFTQVAASAVARTTRDKLRETVTLEDFGAGISGISDAVAWQRAANYCQSANLNIQLLRKYIINTDITLAPGISVLGKSRLTTGLEFLGTASLSMAGTTGTKDAGNMTFSCMLISHATSGTVLKLSNFQYISFFDVELYHGSITAYKFSYLTFLKCIGFDMGVTAANSVNTINEAIKFIGCNFSSVALTITETTDVVVCDSHLLGPASQLSVSRGANPPGLYVLVTVSGTVFDSTDNEAVSLTGCTPRITSSFFSGGRANSKPGLFLFNCAEGSISASTARFCGSHGIQMDNCFGIDVSGNSLTDNQQNGVLMSTCDQVSYRGNLVGNTPGWYGGSYAQQYGIVDGPGNCTNTIVEGNKFVGNVISPTYLPVNSTQFGVNTGILRTNYGTANITTVGGAATISHGLGFVPRFASALIVSGADIDTQITNIDATNVYIRARTSTSNANVNGAFAVLWEARL